MYKTIQIFPRFSWYDFNVKTNKISIIEIVKLLKNRNMPTKFLRLPARGGSQKLAKSSQRILWMAPDLKFRFASHQTYNRGSVRQHLSYQSFLWSVIKQKDRCSSRRKQYDLKSIFLKNITRKNEFYWYAFMHHLYTIDLINNGDNSIRQIFTSQKICHFYEF